MGIDTKLLKMMCIAIVVLTITHIIQLVSLIALGKHEGLDIPILAYIAALKFMNH